MTSDRARTYAQVYVWIWLPNAVVPVVAGVLTRQAKQLIFNYGRSYLARADAVAIYTPELLYLNACLRYLPAAARGTGSIASHADLRQRPSHPSCTDCARMEPDL